MPMNYLKLYSLFPYEIQKNTSPNGKLKYVKKKQDRKVFFKKYRFPGLLFPAMKFWLWQKLPSHNGQLENQAKICEKNAWRNFSSGNRNYDPCEGKKSRINHMVGTAYFLKAWSVPTCLDRRNPSVILWLIELRRLQEEFAWYSVSAVGGYNIGEARAAKRETLRGLQERLWVYGD